MNVASIHAAAGPAVGQFLIALLTILAASRLVGAIGRMFGQPAVVGEIVAGLLLGPSFLGRFAPGTASFLLPTAILPSLSVFAQVGVLLYMFLVGLELDVGALRKQGRAAITISNASTVVPFLAGALLALRLYERFAGGGISFPVFALFLGVSLCVTAFPVLARILTDRQMTATPLGVIALASAAVGDLTAWCLLAFAVSVAQARAGMAVVVTGLAAAYVAFMLLVARPLIQRFLDRPGEDRPLSRSALGGIFLALLLSALATDAIGIHSIFGAFLFGVIIPHDSAIAKDLRRRLEELVVVLFLPVFFVYTGLRTQVGLLNGASDWALCGIVLLVAAGAKVIGATLSARVVGFSWRASGALGALMNTRGLMELVVLNIGLDMGVLTPALFAILVLMAVATTLMTAPALQILNNGEEPVPDGARVRS